MSSGAEWFDPHCHLNLMDDPRGAVQRARAAGVSSMVVIGIDAALSRRALEIAEDEQGVWAAVGIHPNEASNWNVGMLDEVRKLADQRKAVAIGEIGLDFYRDSTGPEDQRRAFSDQLQLAEEMDLAVVVHMRESQDQTLDMLSSAKPRRFVLHCFSGSAEHLARAIGLDAYISFAGNISYPKAEDLRDHVRRTPPDRLLIETDSPFLSPQPKRGEPNEPAYLPLVARTVAEVRGMEISEVADLTARNARRFFGLV